MEYSQTITLDLNSNNAYTTVGAKQGDSGSRTIRVHLTQDGEDYTIPQGTIAYFRLRKPDGKAIANDVTIKNNEIYIVLTAQALAVAGRAYGDITLQNGTQILSTVSFILIIMASPSIASELKSSNEFGYLNQVVSDSINVIYEAEAWATGTRGGVEVVHTDNFDFTFKQPSKITSVEVDEREFLDTVGILDQSTRLYTFTYTEYQNWEMVCHTTTKNEQGETVVIDTDPIIVNLLDYGIVITLDGLQPDVNDWIKVTIVNQDLFTVTIGTNDPDRTPWIEHVTVDQAAFMETVRDGFGLDRTYQFTYNSSNSWYVTCHTINGAIETDTDPDLLNNLDSYGIIVDPFGGSPTPKNGDWIKVNIKQADHTYKNNAKYYAELAKGRKEAIENLVATGEKVYADDFFTWKSYYVGDYVWHNKKIQNNPPVYQCLLYRFIVDHIVPEGETREWNDAEVVEEALVEKDTTSSPAHFHFKVPQGPIGTVNFVTFDVDTTSGELLMNTPDYTAPHIDFYIGCYKYKNIASRRNDGDLYVKIIYGE